VRTLGSLARHLASLIAAKQWDGWAAEPEGQLFSKRLATRYGFDPKVDLLLHKAGRRIAVELEIRRADPVANQVKFLLARRAGELRQDDVEVSMFSSAIERGRRCIASVFAGELRRTEIAAFQVSLLPEIGREEILRLNGAPPSSR
jgi:hypothetical protein